MIQNYFLSSLFCICSYLILPLYICRGERRTRGGVVTEEVVTEEVVTSPALPSPVPVRELGEDLGLV